MLKFAKFCFQNASDEGEEKIEDKIVTIKGYRRRAVVLQLTDQPALSWLYDETTVISIDTVKGRESENLMVAKVWMSPAASGRFDKYFPGYVVRDIN